MLQPVEIREAALKGPTVEVLCLIAINLGWQMDLNFFNENLSIEVFGRC